MILIINFM
jgi:hypothetical protein